MKFFANYSKFYVNKPPKSRRLICINYRILCIGLLAVLSIAFSLILYSSVNGWLWAIYTNYEQVVFHDGTTKLTELSPWRNDLAHAWSEDLMLHDTAGVPDQLYQFGSWIWVPSPQALFPRWGTGGFVLVAVGLWVICVTVPRIAYQTSASPSWAGLESACLSGVRSRVCVRSTIFVLAMMPLLFSASWYICYDRVHSSFDMDLATPRPFRLLFDSFTPRIHEWIMMFGATAIGLYALCWVRFQCFMRSLPHDRVLACRVRCPNRRCRYPFDRSIQKCPECGLNWFAHHPGKEALRRWSLGVKLGSGLVCIMVIASVIWSVTDWDRRYRTWNWLTLRHHGYHWQNLVLPVARPVELQWDEHTIRLVMLVADVQESPVKVSFLAYSIDDGELLWYGANDRIKHADEWLMMGFRGWEDRKQWYKQEPGTRMATVPLAKTPIALRVYEHDLPDEIAQWVERAKMDLEQRTEEIYAQTTDMAQIDHTIP